MLALLNAAGATITCGLSNIALVPRDSSANISSVAAAH
jgi:hypothetical protein